MKFATLCLTLLMAATMMNTGLSKNTHSKSLRRGAVETANNPLEFPRVYTAIVPERTKETTGLQGTHFAAQVDLLGVVETGLPSPYDNTGADYVKISFIVHNGIEMRRLEKLVAHEPQNHNEELAAWNANNLELDVDKTMGLHSEIEYTEPDYEERRKLQQFATIPGFSCYKSFEGSMEFMDELASRANQTPNLSATVKVIGKSYRKSLNSNNGFDIKALHLTGNGVAAAGRSTEKGVYFAMTGIHAREYSPPELVGRWLEFMVDGYENGDADIISILDHTDIHVVLQANPDGRQVAESNRQLLRRKNLNPESGNSFQCGDGDYGVDLNRNFPFKWGLNSGSSGNGCDETFRGKGPASEPEVKAIVDYVSSIFPEGQRKSDPEGQIGTPYPETAEGIFFDIHAYGEVIIWPWGHQDRETANNSGLEGMVNKFRHFNDYGNSGPGAGFLYPASGATDDWAYGALGAAGTTLELGTGFYQRCGYFTNEILPQNIPVLTYAAKVAKAPYSLVKGPDVITINVSETTVTNRVTVVAEASDSAWSKDNHPTSRQQLSDMKVFVDVHPDDQPSPVGISMSGDFGNSGLARGTLALDISSMSVGKHTIYVQATDSAGYKGPITAISFVKEDSSQTTPAPAPTPANTPAVPSPTAESNRVCEDDMNTTFAVNVIGDNRACSWLQNNIRRFDYLCQYLDVASVCPLTCGQCEVFGLTG